MSILILALTIISFNLNAQTAHFVKHKTKDYNYSLDDSEKSLVKQYKRLCSKSLWLKCKENDKPEGALFSRIETYVELQDLGKKQSVADLEGNITEVPLLESVTLEKTIYIHPKNFTIEDRSQEMIDKKAEKEARKAETALIKEMKSHVNDSNLPAWHKQLLKRLIKDMRD